MSDLLNFDSSPPTVCCDEKLLDILLYSNRRIDAKTDQNILIIQICFIPFSSVPIPIVDFEQVNVSCDVVFLLFKGDSW